MPTNRRLTAIVAVALLLFAALAACGGDDDTTSTSSAGGATTTEGAEPADTTAAPETSLAPDTTEPGDTTTAPGGDAAPAVDVPISDQPVTSARLNGDVTYTGMEGAPADVEMSFTGSFDEDADYLQMQMDMTSVFEAAGDEIPPGLFDTEDGVQMEIRTVGDTTYISYPIFSLLGVTTPWVSFPSDGSDVNAITPPTPTNFTGIFDVYAAGATEVSDLGPEEVNGVATTHYAIVADPDVMREQLDPDEFADFEASGQLPLSDIPVDFWIDDEGLVHRMTIDFTAESVALEDGGFESMTAQYDFFDHNVPVTPDVPPAGEVTDGSELGALLGGIGGG